VVPSKVVFQLVIAYTRFCRWILFQ